jgi:hypothetical protein
LQVVEREFVFDVTCVRGTRGGGESLARGIRHHAKASAADPKTAQGVGRAGHKAAVLDYQRTGIIRKQYATGIHVESTSLQKHSEDQHFRSSLGCGARALRQE